MRRNNRCFLAWAVTEHFILWMFFVWEMMVKSTVHTQVSSLWNSLKSVRPSFQQNAAHSVFSSLPSIVLSFTDPQCLCLLRIPLTFFWLQPTLTAMSHYKYPSSSNTTIFLTIYKAYCWLFTPFVTSSSQISGNTTCLTMLFIKTTILIYEFDMESSTSSNT